MNLLHLAAAALLLFVWPVAAGNLISGLKGGHKTSFAGSYAEGAVFMLAWFELIFLIVSATGRGLVVLSRVWGVSTAVVFAAALALYVGGRMRKPVESPAQEDKDKTGRQDASPERKKNDKLDELPEKKKNDTPDTSPEREKNDMPDVSPENESSKKGVGFWVITLICAALIMTAVCISKVPMQSERYTTAETTVTILRDASFFGTDPVTGLMAADVTMEERLCGLPAFYACLCHLAGVKRPWEVMQWILPLWLIAVSFAVLYEAVKRITGRSKGVTVAFGIFTLAALCIGNALRNPFYDLIHVPYEGRTILAFLVLPLLFVILLTGGVHLRSVILLLATMLAAVCCGGFGSGVLPVLIETMVCVICLIGWNLRKRYTV